MLLEATGAPDANEAMHRLYTDEWPRPRVASLSKLVDDAAAEGDAVARDILANAAQQLAMLADYGAGAAVSMRSECRGRLSHRRRVSKPRT